MPANDPFYYEKSLCKIENKKGNTKKGRANDRSMFEENVCSNVSISDI
jgi:hypothetical protein